MKHLASKDGKDLYVDGSDAYLYDPATDTTETVVDPYDLLVEGGWEPMEERPTRIIIDRQSGPKHFDIWMSEPEREFYNEFRILSERARGQMRD